jgi:hypothetical protein
VKKRDPMVEVRVCKLKVCKRDSRKNYGLTSREEERAKHIILRSI